MTCLRSDRKCMVKALGRSRSKFELMSYPSCVYTWTEDITQGKAIFIKEKKGLFFFFLLLSTELMICWELNRGVGIWTHEFYSCAEDFTPLPISAEQVTSLIFLFLLSGQEKS